MQYGEKTDEDLIERHSYYKNNGSFKDYKVKDISLAEWGRQEILLAQDEMPALMQLRENYRDGRRSRSKNFGLHSHFDHTNCCIN